MKEWIQYCETKWNIEILYACEAGSRAWGLESSDSDQDLRFIYKHKDIRTYLSLSKPMEVIDVSHPIDGHGWDIFKAFHLAAKSNPSLYEWAFSPIIYEDKRGFSEKLRKMIVENYSPFSVAMHYLSLMTRNLKEVSGKDNLGVNQQKQMIQIVRSILIIEELIKNDSTLRSPFFNIEKLPQKNMWEKYYHLLGKSKKSEILIQEEVLKEIILELEKEKIRLEASCRRLPKGKDFRGKLDDWLWEVLNV
ncbi:nucleotidyltransferase domain-containing protein [Robertmurraya sp. Marseille-Q9965]